MMINALWLCIQDQFAGINKKYERCQSKIRRCIEPKADLKYVELSEQGKTDLLEISGYVEGLGEQCVLYRHIDSEEKKQEFIQYINQAKSCCMELSSQL